jgi:hypothetical protein
MPGRPRPRSLPLLLAAVLTAAWGSTVQGDVTAAGPGTTTPPGGADGLGGPAAGTAPGGTDGSATTGSLATGTSGTVGAVGPGAAGSGGAADGSTGTTGGLAGGSTSGGATTQGLGVTATTVAIGIVYTENAEAANAAFGIDLASGDTKANAKAIIDDINAHGGVAGRKLVPVFHAYDATSSDTDASQDQAACEDLTKDHKVFAVAGSGLTETWDACMKKAGILNTVGATLTESDREYFVQQPQYFNANAPTRDRVESALVPSLVRQKYFSGWDSAQGAPSPASKPVIGIIGYAEDTWERPLNRILLPKLKAAGYAAKPENIARITAPKSSAEQGPAIAEVQNTVLKFRQNGVTHLIFIDTGGGLTFVFATGARNQSYYPRYGVTSGSGLQGLYDAGEFTDKELAGAMGVAWAPSIDLPTAAGDTYANAATKRCLAVLKERTGQQYASTNEAGIALGQCDEINLIAESIRRAGSVINLSTARSAIERFGGNVQLASRPAYYFGPDRHDGPELGWDMYWDTPCKCAKYVGSSRPLR